ncbi:uncharacterized protein LOC107424571 [Ziziphus jujuba]|uniref:Uncharacterized protein LOC107424571 n=1 Tax=Ziziphus jujuba TaxID=326968 RepID=A0A6P4A6T7_ZIZJJ|nr:uncharacterized protein LOC107424571 [Ziziphus jujuba]
MGDQETPELVLVEKNPEEAGGGVIMQVSSLSSSMMEKEIVGISTLSLETSTTDSASYDSPCSKCGLCPPAVGSNNSSGSLKRASPCSPSSSSVLHDQQYQPKPKKLFLDTHADSSLSCSRNRNDLLRRCVSDPCKPPVTAPTSSVVGTTNQSPEHSVRGGGSVPNQNSFLRRCVSDPCKPPLAPTTHIGTGTTPVPPENPVNGSFFSSSANNLALPPSAVRRSIVDITPPAIAHSTSSTSDKNDSEPDYESYVSVERNGETFRIHLNCQCGRACHLLVDGGDYYYKLM